ncbi:MAG TPA: tetratricopeptide repeat protein [Acidocella sp.]|jgi:hypothetical protein|nr:tetratricopeptide repeat protein [Acidocella sp.]
MNRLWFALPFVAALGLSPIARAQDATPSPQQIQTMIAAGQETQAIQALENVLESHPKSAVAWYLLAEAYDAQGNEDGASSALNMAVRSAPGLPFANPQEVAALRAHINASQPQHVGRGGASTVMLVIGGLVVLFLLLRLFSGRNQAMRQYGYPPPPPAGAPPYGFGYGPPGGGGGLGSALMGGLAAGAGFAAGERIIDGLTGQHGGGPVIDQGSFPQGPDLSRDDGLMGNPGWDNSSNPSDDDLNNTGW